MSQTRNDVYYDDTLKLSVRMSQNENTSSTNVKRKHKERTSLFNYENFDLKLNDKHASKSEHDIIKHFELTNSSYRSPPPNICFDVTLKPFLSIRGDRLRPTYYSYHITTSGGNSTFSTKTYTNNTDTSVATLSCNQTTVSSSSSPPTGLSSCSNNSNDVYNSFPSHLRYSRQQRQQQHQQVPIQRHTSEVGDHRVLSSSSSTSTRVSSSSPFTFIETYSIKRRYSLSPQVFTKKSYLNTDVKDFDTELNEYEKIAAENGGKIVKGSTSQSPRPNSEEFKLKFNQIKSKYNNLIHLSNLYSQGFTNLDNLSKKMDEFTSDLSKIEIKLATQPNVRADLDHLNNELDTLNEIESLFKQREHDLHEINKIHDNLKQTMIKVRHRNNGNSASSSSSSDNSDDINKLNIIISQLNERWHNAFKEFINRKANLKQLLQTYNEYNTSLNTEKNWLQTVRSKIGQQIEELGNSNTPSTTTTTKTDDDNENLNQTTSQTYSELVSRKSLIDDVQQKAVHFSQLAKNLDEQSNNYKQYYLAHNLRSASNSNTLTKAIIIINSSSTTTTTSINTSNLDNNDNLLNKQINKKSTLNNITTTQLSTSSNTKSNKNNYNINSNFYGYTNVYNELEQLNKQYVDTLENLLEFINKLKKANNYSLNEISVHQSNDKLNEIDVDSLLFNEIKMNYNKNFNSYYYSTTTAGTKIPNGNYTKHNNSYNNDTYASNTFFYTPSSPTKSMEEGYNNNNNAQQQKQYQTSSSVSNMSTITPITYETTNGNGTGNGSIRQNKQPIDHLTENLIKQKYVNQHNYPTCRVVSTMSDYRLTLTDFIDLNLIDPVNGLIINPLNGQRLTLIEAIKLELINCDVKEIANIFDSCKTKLTIKEAINKCLINADKNEINVSKLQKLNFIDARKHYLIMKPLTLSEAFMLNLIERDGNVHNPLNKTKISFERLVLNDNNHIGLFDLDTKHIIDPNKKQKLLSINEAISINLILPSTFELNLVNNQQQHQYNHLSMKSSTNNTSSSIRINLHDAFFNAKNFNLSLVLYKPEIENIYIKAAQKYPTKRDKIGLIEAINYNLIDIKREFYNCDYLNKRFTYKEAIENKFIDKELIDVLNCPIGIQVNNCNLKIKDCLNNFSLYLEQCLFKNPFTNDYIHLDSFACKSILNEEIIKTIKRLITRINIKSYIISFNSHSSSIENNKLENNNDSCNFIRVIDVKCPNVIYNAVVKDDQPTANNNLKSLTLEFVIDTQSKKKLSVSEAKSKNIINIDKGIYRSLVDGAIISIEDAIKQGLIGVKEKQVNQTKQYSSTILTNNTKTVVLNDLTNTNSSTQEIKTLTIESVKDATSEKCYSVSEAIKIGLLDKTTLCYKNTKTGQIMSLNDAYNQGYVNGKYENCKNETPSTRNNVPNRKSSINNNTAESSCISNENSSLLDEDREEVVYYIDYIVDPETNTKLTLANAIRIGVFDQKKGIYINKRTGVRLSLSEAVAKGLVEVKKKPLNIKLPNGDSILKIDVKHALDNKLNGNDESITKIDIDDDSVLYQVNEIEETNALPSSSLTILSGNLKDVPIKSKFLAVSTPRSDNHMPINIVDCNTTNTTTTNTSTTTTSPQNINNNDTLNDTTYISESKAIITNVTTTTTSNNYSSTKSIKKQEPNIQNVPVNTFSGEHTSILIDVDKHYKMPERIERVIDDDEDELINEENDTLNSINNNNKINDVNGVKKRKRRAGYRSSIIERRIPSFYGDQSSLETLVIDDVRRSMLLNIEGEVHIHKNKIEIDDDLSQQQQKSSQTYNQRSLIDINNYEDGKISNLSVNRKAECEVINDDLRTKNRHRDEIIIENEDEEYSKKAAAASQLHVIDINNDNSDIKMRFTCENGSEKLVCTYDEEKTNVIITSLSGNKLSETPTIKLRNSMPTNKKSNLRDNKHRTVIIVDDEVVNDETSSKMTTTNRAIPIVPRKYQQNKINELISPNNSATVQTTTATTTTINPQVTSSSIRTPRSSSSASSSSPSPSLSTNAIATTTSKSSSIGTTTLTHNLLKGQTSDDYDSQTHSSQQSNVSKIDQIKKSLFQEKTKQSNQSDTFYFPHKDDEYDNNNTKLNINVNADIKDNKTNERVPYEVPNKNNSNNSEQRVIYRHQPHHQQQQQQQQQKLLIDINKQNSDVAFVDKPHSTHSKTNAYTDSSSSLIESQSNKVDSINKKTNNNNKNNNNNSTVVVNEFNGDELIKDLNKCSEDLYEYEIELVKQYPLSDKIQALRAQRDNFENISKNFSKQSTQILSVISKCGDCLNNRMIDNQKLAEQMNVKCKDLTDRYNLIRDQIELRRKRYENAVEILDKFNVDYVQFMNWLKSVSDKLNNLDVQYKLNADDFNKIKCFETDCKNTEGALLSRQADLRFLKINYQNYSNLTNAFSKDMQTFNSKFKHPQFKRLSTDMCTDLTDLKTYLNEADEKYQSQTHKVNQLKEILCQLIENQKHFLSLCNKFDQWLNETEDKVNTEKERIVKGGLSVNDLQDLSNIFNAIKADILVNKKYADDVKKCGQNLFLHLNDADDSCKQTYLNRIDVLLNRYNILERLVSKQCELLFDKLAHSRNIQENFDSTTNWLNEVEKSCINPNESVLQDQLIKSSSKSQFEDKVDLLKRTKADLKSRKELILQTIAKNKELESQADVKNLLKRVDSAINNVEQKEEKTRNLTSLMQNYNQIYDNLDDYCKKSASAIDSINPLDKVLDSSISELNKFNEEIIQKSKALDDLRKTITKIENQVGNTCDTSALNSELDNMQYNFEQLINITATKLAELNSLNDMKRKYLEHKLGCEKWLNEMELRIHSFEPIAVDLEIVETQYDKLEKLLKSHSAQENRFKQLNEISLAYLSLLSKQQQQQSMTPYKHSVLKRKIGSNPSSRYNSNENLSLLNDKSGTSTSGSGNGTIMTFNNDDIEIEHDLRKINELYEWTGQSLKERQNDLIKCLDHMKSYLEDIHKIDKKLNEFDNKLNKIYSFSNDPNTIKYPLSENILTHVNNQMKNLLNDLTQLNNDIDSIKQTSKQHIFGRLTNDKRGIDDVKRQLKELIEKYTRVNNSYHDKKDKLDLFVNNLTAYGKCKEILEYNMEQKTKMLNTLQINIKLSDLLVIDSQLQQIELLKTDLLSKDHSLLDNLNRYGEALIETSLSKDSGHLHNELEQINNKFDMLVENYTQLFENKQQIKEICLNFNDLKSKFYDNLNKIDNRLNEINAQTELCSQPDLIMHELNMIENESLSELHKLLNMAQECVQYLIGLQLNDSNSGVLNEELKQNIFQMKTALNNTINNLKTIKSNYDTVMLKQSKFQGALHDLNDFVEEKANKLQFEEPISALYDKLIKQRTIQDLFHRELELRREDVRKLSEYAHKNYEKDPKQQESMQKVSNLETNWNNLFSKSELRKDKLLLCYDLAQQFTNDYDQLNSWSDKTMRKLKDIQLNPNNVNKNEIERNLKIVDTIQNELKTKSNELNEFVTVADELKLAAQVDQKPIEEKTENLKNSFNTIQIETKTRAQSLNDTKQRLTEYEDTVSDIKKSLNESEQKLKALIYESSINSNGKDLKKLDEYKQLQEHMEKTLKQKIDLCNDIAKGLVSDNQSNELIEKSVNDLNRVYETMDKKLNDKLNEIQTNNAELDDCKKDIDTLVANLNNIENYFEANDQKTLVLDEDSLKAQQNQLSTVKTAIEQCNDQFKKANDTFKKLVSKGALNWNDSLKEELNDISKRFIKLDTVTKTHDKELTKTTDNLRHLQEKINNCNEKIVSTINEIDMNKPISNNPELIDTLINDHKQFEHKFIEPLKAEIQSINTQTTSLYKEATKTPNTTQSTNTQLTSLDIELDKLTSNYKILNKKLSEHSKQLETALFKTSKFENSIGLLNDCLITIENELDNLNKAQIGLYNVHVIDEQLAVCNQLETELTNNENNVEDLKEISEKLIDNCETNDDRDLIEQRMNSVVSKFNLMNKQINEKTNDLKYLNVNLNQLKDNYETINKFLLDLDTQFLQYLNLNCVEPIVIKNQYEHMRELNDTIIANHQLMNDTKELCLTLVAENDELNDETNGDLKRIQQSIDKADLETKINEMDVKYGESKFILEKNLDLVQRLYPLCEEFSMGLLGINEAITKCEGDLDWLKTTPDDETNIQEKQGLLDEIHSNSYKTGQLVENLESQLSSKIIDELNFANIQHDDLINDLNENISQIKQKYSKLNNNINEYMTVYLNKKAKAKEIFGEIDDIQEWLDEIESKLTNIDTISYMPEIIKQQLQEQVNIENDIQTQINKLKDLRNVKIKKLVRDNQIEDSIELKERVNNLQAQSNSLLKISHNRLNELEQALAISITFKDLTFDLRSWFEDIENELVKLDKQQKNSIEKESLIKELNHIKQLDRIIYEKKSDFDNLSKSGQALAKLCNKNATNESNDDSVVPKETASSIHLKQLIDNANQRYLLVKRNVKHRIDELENLLWKSAEFIEKLDNLTNELNTTAETVEYAEPISAHPDKLRQQIEENRMLIVDLEKRKKSLEDLRNHAKNGNIESIKPNDEEALKEIDDKICDLDQLLTQVREVSETRATLLEETLECSEKFWNDCHNIMEVIGDLEDRVKQIENETVAMDADSVNEQHQLHEQIVKKIDSTEPNIEYIRAMGTKLLQLCGKADQPEVEKTIEEIDHAWDKVKQTVREREVELQDTFGKACEFQEQLIEVLEWISTQQEKFANLDSSYTSNDSKTIRFQINLLKEFKEQIDPKQFDIQVLNQQFNELKSNLKTNQSVDVLEALQEPLNSANKEWKRLQNSIVERKSSLQNALLSMGQFSEALEEMLKWLERTNKSLDDINVENLNEVRYIDIELARLKMLQNDIRAQESSVEKLKDTAKNLIRNESTGKQSVEDVKSRVQLLIDNWQNLLFKSQDKQKALNDRLFQSQNFQSDLQDMLLWLSEIEHQLISNKPFGGLPETAREQLEKFMHLYMQLDSNESKVKVLLTNGQILMQQNNTLQQKNLAIANSGGLLQSVETLANRWNHVRKRASDRKEKLESAYKEAVEFHNLLQKFISWLTETEKVLNTLKPVSRVLDTVTGQIGEHQLLQKNISEHRDQMLTLDKIGTHLKYYSQKQDVILVKNLLISVQNRWEKIVSRSAERTRDLERGFKDAKQFFDMWKELLNWLNQNLEYFQQDLVISNQPSKIKQQINKHKEFHRNVSQRQPNYELNVKIGKKLVEKCDSEQDKLQLHDMLNELKNKWQTLCYQSVERQKKLEDALLCSGQFRDALQGLLDWLLKAEVYLSDESAVNGDLECVNILIEEFQRFQQEFHHRQEQVVLVRKAANELMATSSEDSSNLNLQLTEMNNVWEKVLSLGQSYKLRLDVAYKLAKEFHTSVKARLEWLAIAEQQLKYNISYLDNELEILELIEQHQNFVSDLRDQEVLVKNCLTLGQEILNTCVPEAAVNLKHWLAVVQSRWDEINKLCDQKTERLNESLNICKENEALLNELLAWLQGAEATLTALDQKPLPNSIELAETLLQDHQEFQTEMTTRQTNVERITKSSCVKDSDYLNMNTQHPDRRKSSSIKTLSKGSQSGWKTPEPKMRNPRVKTLFDRWRKVWLLSVDRHRKLREQLDRLKELERLKNFNFEEWRKRYMNWIKDNRARIMDFFRRQDKDHDGKISREEFIEGILQSNRPNSRSNFPTTRLELEAVADIFDLDKDGYIDYKEFFATLKPNASNKPNLERIRDEVQRQVSLCKCSKRYHVVQISERHYRFGDSQKLRLVRILQSTVMVRVGGGWMALDEFLVKNDPCRAKGRTNFEIREQYLLRDPPSQTTTIYRHRSPNRININNVNNNTNNQSTIKQREKSFSLCTSSLIPIALRYQRIDENQSLSSTSRSAASSSGGTNYEKRSSLSHSNDALLALTNSPMRSTANSQSGSLGASMSDLSSEAASEYSDTVGNKNGNTNGNSNGNGHKSLRSIKNSKSTSSQSKLPIPKKTK